VARIAIVSDIHGNAYALDVVMGELRREQFDHTVCLGDAVQGGAQPAETVARLRDAGWPIVMGNADAWLLTGEETGRDPIARARLIKMNAIRDWSLSQLSSADRAFIEAFRPTVQFPLDDGCSLLCFHGSPASFDDIILPTTPELELEAMLKPYLPNVLTGGHTHMQQFRRIGATSSFYINPGSVGFAYSHQQGQGEFHADAWAEYAILTAIQGRVSLEFRRVPYDAAAVRDIYRRSGRPHADEAIAQYNG
jgi:predicted phosphodiesterase